MTTQTTKENLIIMKYMPFLIIGILSLFMTNIQAQSQKPCGTQMTYEDLEWLRKFKANPPIDFQKSDEIYYLPIQAHIIGEDDGSGYLSVSRVLEVMCALNNYAEVSDLNMRFFLHNNEIKYINNSNYYTNNNYSETAYVIANQTMGIYNEPGVINVYFADYTGNNCGYFAPGGDAIAMANGCSIGSSTTIIHEMGHYFSLAHTFFGWEYVPDGQELPVNEREKVVRTGPDRNCHYTADYFCDTDPDYAPGGWNDCSINEFVDPDGVAFIPDSSLFMNYAAWSCKDRFSPEQMEAMEANLLFQREYLLESTQELNFNPIHDAAIVYPAPYSQNIPYQDVTLRWSEVEGARYMLHVFNSVIGYKLETIVEDNQYTLTDLLPDTNYYWELLTFNEGNFCQGTITVAAFKTSENVATSIVPNVLEVNRPCDGENNGSIFIEATGGVAPYTYVWEDGTTGQLLENISDGSYLVTITDVLGATNDININVDEQTPLMIDIRVQDNQTMSFVNGGVPPYNYTWANGENTGIIDAQEGFNELVVGDANGCETSISFNLATVNGEVTNLTCKGDGTGRIELTDFPEAGYNFEWSNGAEGTLLENLPAGTYTLILTEENGNDDVQMIFEFEVTQPAELLEGSVSISGTEGTCEITGGVEPYDIQWSNGDEETMVTDLPAGNDTLLITDANGCSLVLPYQVLGLEASIKHLDCNGDTNGNILLMPSGGTSPYTYEWNDGNTYQNRYGLGGGLYTVTVTDATGVNNTFEFTLEEPELLEIEIEQDGINVTVVIEGGTPPYEIEWSNDSEEETVEAIIPGIYAVEVEDANGCKETISITIEEDITSLVSMGLNSFHLYPNPIAKGQNLNMQVDLKAQENVQVSVYNSAGKCVEKIPMQSIVGEQNIVLSSPQWSIGLYFVEVQIGSKRITRKLVVN